MNNHGRRRLDAETADGLLAGHTGARTEFGELAGRPSAASVPGFPGELAGEDAARAAFRAADVEPVPDGRRSVMLKSAVAAKLLTLKAAVVAAAVVSAGGVALAASTGVLPNPLAPQGPAHPTPTSTHSNGPDATPSPSLVGLCTAYLAGAGDANEHVSANPAFTALVTAAGGEDNVTSFCDGLGVTPSTGPDGAGPSDHPTGAPSQLPTPSLSVPTPSHPTGQPTGLPSTTRP